ncbi:restriction endonuclease subunit S [Cohnella algarum]|uniref:restriction endonuclease subunit S n=1 Tax=Cohnella algarum TaxID=2044859 RepID=UPI001966E92C|nr:restriction endonuclease subunit S [Cohnella algarum]
MRVRRVGDLFTIAKGKKYEGIQGIDANEMVRYIQIEDLRNDKNIKWVSRIDNGVYVTSNDILIAWDGANAGTIGYNLTGIIGSTLAVLRPRDSNNYIPYIAMFLRSKSSFLRENCTGATIPHIQKKVLEDIEVPLPSFEQQKEIAYILDKAQALIDKRKQAIAKLDELVQAVFLDLFGDPIKNAKSWKISKLKEVSELITDGTHHSPEPMTEGIPYITAKHVKVNNIDFYSNPTYISESDHTAIYKRCPVKKGDILYIKDGATTGIAAINPYEFEFSMLSSLALIRIDIKYATPQYVVSYLNNQYVKEQITNNMSGAAIKRLTLAKINDIKIPIPDLETQHKYVGVFERYLIQKGKLIESLQQLESNFQALLQKAFKGELIVRDGVTV